MPLYPSTLLSSLLYYKGTIDPTEDKTFFLMVYYVPDLCNSARYNFIEPFKLLFVYYYYYYYSIGKSCHQNVFRIMHKCEIYTTNADPQYVEEHFML